MQIERLGPYIIGKKLGRGGMGTVYEGVHAETGEAAAVKLLAESLVHEPDFRHRFEAEIETLRKLNHPHIVRLFGFGEEGEHLFYTMELVSGSSLEKELGRGRVFAWREVLTIGIELAQALRHAHDRGVIHRDIKPGNLLLTADGQIKLSDFGIARLFGSHGQTTAGSVLGTAEFMAPEQADGRAVSPRSDLYSLGAVLYVLLTGRPLYRGKSLPEILLKQRLEQPPPLGQLVPDVPAEMQQVVMQLLAKDPDERIPTAGALLRRLEAIERSLPAAGADAAVSSPPAPAVPPEDLAPTLITKSIPSLPGAGPAAAAEDLPGTEVTAALPPPTGPPPGPPPEAVKPAGRFTLVGKEELDRTEPAHPAAPYLSFQTVALAAGLLAVAGAIFWLLQPPSAQGLFERIVARARRNDAESQRQAGEDIEEFLRRFAGDPRCAELRRKQEEIELDRLQRKFDLRAKGLGAADSLLPVEQAYLDALNYARLDPQRGMTKLQALLDLYGDQLAAAAHAGQCAELARRRLAQLKEQFNAPAGDCNKFLAERLDEADRLGRTDPERAKTIYRAVIELYARKPWAAAAVRRARDALGSEQKSPPSSD